MKKLLFAATALTALGLSAVTAASAHITVKKKQGDVKITTTDLGNGVYMLEGQGGNIGLSVGEDGVFMIDDQFGRLTDKILAAVAELTDEPVEYVLNTHWHGDHTGGNENMAKAGATILAHDNVRKRLKEGLDRGNGRVTPPAPDAALPVITFSETTTFHWNGNEIFIYHFPYAHTDGDAIVFIKNLNIMHLGDTFFSRRYPFIDLASGGTVEGFIGNLEAAAALADENTQIIPGHGPLSTKQDVEDMIALLTDAVSKVEALIGEGLNEDEIVAADPLQEYNDEYAWGFINGERMTRTLVQSLSN